MVDRLIRGRATVGAAMLLLSAGSAAQALSDPTRPPLELLRAAVANTATGEAAGAVARPRLEAILLSSARKGAIINGEYVHLGGAYGKAVLVEINATKVILRTDQKLEVLQLYPVGRHAVAASGVDGKPEKMVKRP